MQQYWRDDGGHKECVDTVIHKAMQIHARGRRGWNLADAINSLINIVWGRQRASRWDGVIYG